MAEAVAVLRAKKQAEASGEGEASLTRSKSLLEEKFDAYEVANYRMWVRSKSDGAPSKKHRHHHDLDFLDRYDSSFGPANAELMTRVARGSFGPSDSVTEEDDAASDDGVDGGSPGGGAGDGGGADGGGGRGEGRALRDDGSGNERESGDSSIGGGGGSGFCGAEVDRGFASFFRRFRVGSRRNSSSKSGGDGSEGAEGKAAGSRLVRSLTADTGESSMGGGGMGGHSMGPQMRSASGVLRDTEIDEMDGEVLQEAFGRVLALEQRVRHYRDLGGFVVLMALFIAILYLQADSSRSFQITAAHSVLYPPDMRQDASNTFAGTTEFYDWLNNTVIQNVWADFTCGDGTCHRPFQFPAFGRFGCEADCGTFPNLTSVVVRFSSQLDTQQAAEESSWNLCMVNPVSLCWYESLQPFPRGEADLSIPMDIPDGEWTVVLNAPAGGIRGTVHAPPPGTRRFSVIGSANTVELAAWGYCAHDDDADDANGTGSAAASDVCRDTCVSLVACLPAACSRAFTEREVAGAFVDCARMCIVSPATITLYAGNPCPVPDIATVFSNTPCNVSGFNSTARISRLARRKAQTLHKFHQPHAYGQWPASAALSASPAAASPPPVLARPAAAASADSTVMVTRKLQGEQSGDTALAPPPPPAPTSAVAAAAAAAAMAAAGTTTEDPSLPAPWSLLGATDRQRMTALQVAVSRALFTMAKDRCLAGRAPGSGARPLEGGAGSVGPRIVACLCTVLGGPAAGMEECRFTDEAGRQVVTAGDMYAYLQRTHVRGGRVISSQHMRRFVQTVVAALLSVTPMADASAARVNSLLHAFDGAIVTSQAVGCTQGGAWLQWRAGVKHNTTIHVGDKVTWVWDDDLPHSLRVAGMGEAGAPLFHGFGGNRLAVARQLACSPMNAGGGDASEDPLPCVLSMDGEPAGSFSYSKLFEQPATIYYQDGALPGGDQASLSSSSSVSASVLTVLPERTEADDSGVVNATGNSTSTTPSPPSSAAVYFCAPRCRLQRLANGVCDAACNVPACAFDGGDCACVDPLFGPGICSCPPGHTRRDDGSCCLSTAVGANLNFPFSLQRYGPNYTESNYAFAAERGTAVNRFVSTRNRLLIGMVLEQERWGTQVCSGQGVLHLAGWCSNGTSREPFGVNPHFLPTSAIYDSAATANMSQLDNNTFGFKLKFNPQGLPYGFIYPIDSLSFYPLVFDINLDSEAAMRRLTYLVDGSYIDNGTRSIDVSFITFNGETRTFVVTTVSCTVSVGGSMAVAFKSQPAAMAMYDASADNIARLVLEIIYVVGLLWNVCGEVQEMLDRAAMDGSVLSYFGLAWNWIDMLSLGLQVAAIAIWIVLWRYVEAFDMQPRYDIYYTLLEMPRYWAVPNPPTGFLNASQAFLDLRNIINLRAVYFALQGINVFCMMVRLLKFMDFQPYLGVITRSLALATPSLLHFFLLSFAVFFCFSMYGYLVFGGAIEQFSTVLESMFSCFLLLLNDNSSAYFFQRLESWDLIAAMLFFFMFIVFMVFILLNFLIAIIVDAFMSVKDANVVATSIAADLTHIFKYRWNCWRGRYLPYWLILDRLVELGARDTRVDEADRRMRRYKSIQRRMGSVLPGSLGRGFKQSLCTQADNRPAFPSAGSGSRVRRQHVLTVREKRIDAISLAMILQRRLDRAQARAGQSAPAMSFKPPPIFSLAACAGRVGACSESGHSEEEAGLEHLSQALVLQCGEVVRQAALPVKKPVQKLSLLQIQEEVVRSQQAVEEVRGMMADMQSDVRAMAAMLAALHQATMRPSPPSAEAVPTQSLPVQPPLEQPSCLKRELAECEEAGVKEGGDGGGGDGDEAVGGSASGGFSAARISRSLSQPSRRGSGRRVSFREDASTDVDDEGGAVHTGEEAWRQPLIENHGEL
ncbi:hypothetical protein CLOM_g15776 [Closterium sp. NIES-68]|nr:hypothetical protein CLOM_g15776 [Closterium sp. NIES-68]GJP78776.1 hypothetical protein CLOP_g9049 [Closterium sp. NIES-67]